MARDVESGRTAAKTETTRTSDVAIMENFISQTVHSRLFGVGWSFCTDELREVFIYCRIGLFCLSHCQDLGEAPLIR